MGEEEKVVCPKCGAEMANGKFGIYCTGHCGFRIGKVMGEEVSDEQKFSLLAGKEIFLENLTSKRTGKTYSVYVKSKGIRPYTYTKQDGTTGMGYDLELECRFPDKKEGK
ncbi:MAG: hypothetical protein K6B72_07570 [Lachnospiraceae bacterium]|nr:hypothetical protein [Lachnospiraceae bacterium]